MFPPVGLAQAAGSGGGLHIRQVQAVLLLFGNPVLARTGGFIPE